MVDEDGRGRNWSQPNSSCCMILAQTEEVDQTPPQTNCLLAVLAVLSAVLPRLEHLNTCDAATSLHLSNLKRTIVPTSQPDSFAINRVSQSIKAEVQPCLHQAYVKEYKCLPE